MPGHRQSRPRPGRSLDIGPCPPIFPAALAVLRLRLAQLPPGPQGAPPTPGWRAPGPAHDRRLVNRLVRHRISHPPRELRHQPRALTCSGDRSLLQLALYPARAATTKPPASPPSARSARSSARTCAASARYTDPSPRVLFLPDLPTPPSTAPAPAPPRSSTLPPRPRPPPPAAISSRSANDRYRPRPGRLIPRHPANLPEPPLRQPPANPAASAARRSQDQTTHHPRTPPAPPRHHRTPQLRHNKPPQMQPLRRPNESRLVGPGKGLRHFVALPWRMNYGFFPP